MITEDDIDYVFQNLEERRDIEFKQAINWNTSDGVKACITKDMMAFSNIKTGGYLVIGVRQNSNHSFTPVGITLEVYDSHNLDSVLPYINSKAEPPVNVELRKFVRDGMRFVIYKIYPFENYPVFCKNEDNASTQLHRGVIYTRTTRMYESAPIQNQTEMNEIKEMILDRSIEEYTRRTQQMSRVNTTSDEQQFDSEIEGLP